MNNWDEFEGVKYYFFYAPKRSDRTKSGHLPDPNKKYYYVSTSSTNPYILVDNRTERDICKKVLQQKYNFDVPKYSANGDEWITHLYLKKWMELANVAVKELFREE